MSFVDPNTNPPDPRSNGPPKGGQPAFGDQASFGGQPSSGSQPAFGDQASFGGQSAFGSQPPNYSLPDSLLFHWYRAILPLVKYLKGGMAHAWAA